MTIRILYVITKANWGGAQRYVYDLAISARDAGNEVAVAVGGTGILTEKLRSASIRVIELPLRQERIFLLDLLTFSPLFSLVHLFRTEHPDVVHVNSAKAGGLGTLAARLVHVPRIIFTAHGWEFNAPRSHLSKIGIRFFSWLTILLSHATICVSDAIRRDIAWMPWVGRKLVVIHNGVACEPLLPRDEARRILCPHTTLSCWIGMLSELHPTKRIDDAIRAFAYIVPRHPNTGLFIISEGEERKKLENLVRDLHLGGSVVLLGFIQDAPQYFSAFDMFVHASQSEALSLAVLEAGCASLPVVATSVGGIPEIIPNDNYGLLVRPRDPKELAAAIESIMRDPRRAAELGENLHTRVRHSFSKRKMVSDTLALY